MNRSILCEATYLQVNCTRCYVDVVSKCETILYICILPLFVMDY